MNTRISAAVAAALFLAGGLFTWFGHPEREVSFASAGELWADVLRDADQLGLQLTRMSDAEEMDLGRKLAQPYLQAPVTAWQSYVDAVGQSLARHVSRTGIRYQFHVIDAPWVNAFALPGGQIFVFTGLLGKAASESELAAVLAHEIAHIDARHCAERYQYELKLARLKAGDLARLGNLPQAVLSTGYAQRHELEADTIGLRLAAAAGYDARGAERMFQHLAQTQGTTSAPAPATPLDEMLRAAGTAATDWLRSHPPTPERIRRVSALAARYPAGHVGTENHRRRIPRSQQQFPEPAASAP